MLQRRLPCSVRPDAEYRILCVQHEESQTYASMTCGEKGKDTKAVCEVAEGKDCNWSDKANRCLILTSRRTDYDTACQKAGCKAQEALTGADFYKQDPYTCSYS